MSTADAIQIVISLVSVAIILGISYGGRKSWEGVMKQWKLTMEDWKRDISSDMDKQYTSIKQLCVKHQEDIENLNVEKAVSKARIEEHDRRISDIECHERQN